MIETDAMGVEGLNVCTPAQCDCPSLTGQAFVGVAIIPTVASFLHHLSSHNREGRVQVWQLRVGSLLLLNIATFLSL